MSDINNPHDRFFRNAMSDIRVAKDLLQTYLPPSALAALDFNSLKMLPTSFVDQNLKLSLSDVLYEAKFNDQTGLIYFLLEHQSTIDPFMPFRIWEYIISIWRNYIKQHPHIKKLPLIIPLVFYNDPKPYDGKTDLRELIDAPKNLIDDILFQPFQLIDVNRIDDAELKQHLWSGIMMFFMKHIYARDFLIPLKEVFDLLQELDRQGASDYVTSLLYYCIKTGQVSNHQTLVDLVQSGLPYEGEKAVTAAEMFIQEGIERGIKQGLQQQQNLLLTLLQSKFKTIPEFYEKQLKTADQQSIQRWAKKLLLAENLDEIFAA